MKAIKTVILPDTDTKPSRIKASAGKHLRALILPYDCPDHDNLSDSEIHARTAGKFALLQNWSWNFVSGYLEEHHCGVHVFLPVNTHLSQNKQTIGEMLDGY